LRGGIFNLSNYESSSLPKMPQSKGSYHFSEEDSGRGKRGESLEGKGGKLLREIGKGMQLEKKGGEDNSQ